MKNQLTILWLIFIFSVNTNYAQNVGIGTATPNINAMLDITSTNKGVLIPRIALDSLNSAFPLGTFVSGMMVYNTSTSGSGINKVSPGFYFCINNKWEKIGSGWSLTGNAGTSPNNNFLGTLDDNDIVLKRNNIQSGLLNSAFGNTSLGVSALDSLSVGVNNTAIGKNALSFNSYGSGNVAVGTNALQSNTEGENNTSIGLKTMALNKTGRNNVAIGRAALESGFQASENVAIGDSALNMNGIYEVLNFPPEQAKYNTGVGSKALRSNVFGYKNTASGTQSLYFNERGHSNTANGAFSLFNNSKTLFVNANASGLSSYNTASGAYALYSNDSGSNNTALGAYSLFNSKGSNLVAVGDSTLFNNSLGATHSLQGSKNTGVGSRALLKNTIGLNNTALGYNTLYNNVNGSANTAIGSEALFTNLGSSNTAIGVSSLYSNQNGENNTAVGTSVLESNFNGSGNTALGNRALLLNDTGSNNTAIGLAALTYNTTQSHIVAIGDSALFLNGLNATLPDEGTGNTAVGSKALKNNSVGYSNTALGFESLYSSQNSFNTATGFQALKANSSGSFNTAFGAYALSGASGSGNVALGYLAGSTEPGSNKLYINNNSGNQDNTLIYGEFDTERLRINKRLGIGMNSAAFPLEIKGIDAGNDDLIKFYNSNGVAKWHQTMSPIIGNLSYTETNVADNRLVLSLGGLVGLDIVPNADLHIKQINDLFGSPTTPNSNGGLKLEKSGNNNSWNILTDEGNRFDFNYNGVTKAQIDPGTGAYIIGSDQRLKKNIQPLLNVLNDVLKLEAQTYHYINNDDNEPMSFGFLAQDVEKIFPDFVTTRGNENMKGISYQNFTVVAIQAIKEQQSIIKKQDEKMNSQSQKLDLQAKKIEELERKLNMILDLK